MDKNKIVFVIGGGASGMMAAITAAKEGCHVFLLEKNSRLGKKMLITGKGRCNITNDVSVGSLVKAMVGNGKFLYGAFSAFSAEDTMAWFQEKGVALKTERGQRVFPQSDDAKDIVAAMERELHTANVKIEYQKEVKGLVVKEGKIIGVKTAEKAYGADAVILATGGASYPLTGSTGDGYHMAKAVGHYIEPITPALVPLVVKEKDVKDLEGLSLRNVELKIKYGEEVMGKEFGEMVFTDFGLSGPVVLTLSRLCGKHFAANPKIPLTAVFDLKPALTTEQLDLRLQRDFDTHPKRNYQTILEDLLPKKLIPIFVVRSGIDPWTKVHELNREKRKTILSLLKNFSFTITACRPMKEAIITAGGINVKEIDPKTMGSKKIDGLFFGGEVMDIDGVTGGFNLQAALSTGYRSGLSAAAYVEEIR